MLEKLNDDNSFNMEFEKIKNIYPIDGCRDVYDFIKENRGLIIVLNKIRYLLKEYAPYSYVKLFLDNDPLFVPQLWLAVRAPKKEFYNGFDDSIEKIESTIIKDFYSKTKNHKNLIFIIKTKNNKTFGGFSESGFNQENNNNIQYSDPYSVHQQELVYIQMVQ